MIFRTPLNTVSIIYHICTIILMTGLSVQGHTTVEQNHNILDYLQKNYPHKCSPLKLHLGCGQTYFTDYINIDFPPSEHTVQTTIKADLLCDITHLALPANTVHEVRSHHFFEHFDRPTALAMICAWHTWIHDGGFLVIETPDLERSMQMLLDTQYSYIQKQSIMRHVFGSHEAPWATHCDGWYQEKFEHILQQFGFEVIQVKKSQWHLTANITITARKRSTLPITTLQQTASHILAQSLVDQSPSEQCMLAIWYQAFETSLHKMLS